MRNLPVCVNCNICSTCVFISMLCVTMSISRGHRRHMQQSQPHTTQQQVDMDFVEFPPVQAQSHAAKRYLAGEGPQVKCVQRTGPVLFCVVCDCCSQSQLGQQVAWTQDKMVDRTELSDSKRQDILMCIKSNKPSRIYTSMHKSTWNMHLHL